MIRMEILFGGTQFAKKCAMCGQLLRYLNDQLPVRYQFMKWHMIFNVKFGENFHGKAWLVAGGHMIETPATLTYLSVVSSDSVQIALSIAALNDFQVMSCDKQNTYLTADCQEKTWMYTGSEFG